MTGHENVTTLMKQKFEAMCTRDAIVEEVGARPRGGEGGDGGEPLDTLDIAGNIAHRGVTVGFLRCLTDCFSLWDKPTWWVVQHIIKPITDGRACRFVSLEEMAPFVGPAAQFVSHAWGATWGSLVAAVGEHSCPSRCVWVVRLAPAYLSVCLCSLVLYVGRATPGGYNVFCRGLTQPHGMVTIGWVAGWRPWRVDIMAVNEHPGHDQDNDLLLLKDAVESMPQGTLLVWDDTAWQRWGSAS